MHGRQLRAEGKLTEALDDLEWCWFEARKNPPAFFTAHFFGLLDDLKQLARSSDEARTRIRRWRDGLTAELTSDASMRDWSALNVVLGEEARTLEWLESATAAVPPWLDVERDHQLVDLLVRHGRWPTLGKLIREPLRHVAEVAKLLEVGQADSNWEGATESAVTALRGLLRDGCARTIHALEAAGRGADAQAVREQALELDPSEQMRVALGLSPAG